MPARLPRQPDRLPVVRRRLPSSTGGCNGRKGKKSKQRKKLVKKLAKKVIKKAKKELKEEETEVDSRM